MERIGRVLIVIIATAAMTIGIASVGMATVSTSQPASGSAVHELEYGVPGRGPMTPKPAPAASPGPPPSPRATPSPRPGLP
jgi:hypothetical protein